jgi:hypothetical protein
MSAHNERLRKLLQERQGEISSCQRKSDGTAGFSVEEDHETDHLNEQEQEEELSVGKEAPKKQSRGKKRNAPNQFRKAPGAPKRFKSNYIFFFTDCQAKLKKELEPSEKLIMD